MRRQSASHHWRGGWGGKGDHPRTVTPLPFVTQNNISVAGTANNGERDSGGPPPSFRTDQISSAEKAETGQSWWLWQLLEEADKTKPLRRLVAPRGRRPREFRGRFA